MKNLKADIAKAQREFAVIVRKLTGIVKVEGLQFIADNFSKQGFQKGSGAVSKWKGRKVEAKAKEKSRAILVQRGHLQRRWGGDTSVQDTKVIFQNNLPYAEVHNEGGKAGRGSGFQMPQRQMIGDSPHLDSMIEKKITRMMDCILG